MLDGLFMLLVLSLVMATASFLAGALPLSMSLSQSQLRLISTIGMGVLVGTSLIVIIPEGIEAVYTAGSVGNPHTKRGLAGMLNGKDYLNTRRLQDVNWSLQPRSAADLDAFNALPGPTIPADIPGGVSNSDDPPVHGSKVAVSNDDSAGGASLGQTEEHHETDPPTFYVGLSLIFGFILMFLIDKLPRHASEQLAPPPPTRHISLNNLSQGLHESNGSADEDLESESFLQSLTPTPKQSRSLATTTGLVIHAAADGIAMGASASTSNTNLGFIIFLAIMIHKAPAAFGLTSVLLKQGLSKRAARGHLIIFSLAAPIGALSTFFLVHMLGGGGIDSENGQWWTGMLLLFSAGTFLYVAMHAMQEDSNHGSHQFEQSGSSSSASNGYADSSISQSRKQPRPQMRDTFAAVAGMLLPLLTQIGHGHGH